MNTTATDTATAYIAADELFSIECFDQWADPTDGLVLYTFCAGDASA